MKRLLDSRGIRASGVTPCVIPLGCRLLPLDLWTLAVGAPPTSFASWSGGTPSILTIPATRTATMLTRSGCRRKSCLFPPVEFPGFTGRCSLRCIIIAMASIATVPALSKAIPKAVTAFTPPTWGVGKGRRTTPTPFSLGTVIATILLYREMCQPILLKAYS